MLWKGCGCLAGTGMYALKARNMMRLKFKRLDLLVLKAKAV